MIRAIKQPDPTGWRRRALGRGLTSHVSRLMAETVGTLGTVGNDSRRQGLMGDRWDFGDRLADVLDARVTPESQRPDDTKRLISKNNLR